MKRKSEGKSLKTFIIYASVVCFFVLLSFAVKAFFVIKASKFDGQHQFVLAVVQKEKIQQLIAFAPSESEVTVLKLSHSSLSIANLKKILGIIPDAILHVEDDLSFDQDAGKTMTTLLLHYPTVKTDMTFIDAIRLFVMVKRTQPQVKELSNTQDARIVDQQMKRLLTDSAISQENISVQIINASGTSGMGKNLERIVANMGGNVVSVETAKKKESSSKIRYFGKETYTLAKLHILFGFSVEKMEQESIANIVIVIGER